MRGIRLGLLALAAIGATALNAAAQQTAGNVNGRVLDQQQAAMPGVTVTGTNTATGYNRVATTDAEGVYHLTALPVGTYQLKVELSGFQSLTREILVEVGANIDVNFELQVQSLSESVEVTAESPLIETSTSSVGGVVDTKRIESMPLNGRQFANLAATIPGVGLGFHSDPTKSTQYAPQIGGGNGRNINYQIDGGDNNDDTVGGLLQLFPLEAIDQFNVITSRYKAEYGRSNGGVMNIVTKSGTNQNSGSWFTLFRDDSLNAQTETEKLNDVEKQDYRRWQYGGSFGGPIVKNKIHYFGAFERTQQDTFQSVNTQGLFPNEDGIFALPYRETLVTVKGTATFNADNYLSVRYGRNENSQPYARRSADAAERLGRQLEHVQLDQRQLQHGARLGEAERVHLPVRRLQERHPAAQHRSAANVPEWRRHRSEPEHAAGHRAAEVAVPRRLLVVHLGEGRHRPWPQGRRELDPRAQAVHHVRHRQGRAAVHAPGRHARRPDCDRDPE